jgi:hypothetical protein
MFWYFCTFHEFNRNTQPQHNTTNIITMVGELLAPPGVWIDESTLPKGQVALRVYCPRPPTKDFNRLIKIREKLENTIM